MKAVIWGKNMSVYFKDYICNGPFISVFIFCFFNVEDLFCKDEMSNK